MATTRVIIVDDHPILRAGIRALLESTHHMQVIGEAATGEEAVHLVRELAPDVVLLDINLPDVSGIEVTKRLNQLNLLVPILVLSGHDNVEYIQELLESGVAGYLLKDEAAPVIVQTLQKVAQGETGYFSPRIHRRLQKLLKGGKESTLTERERKVLKLVAEGKTNHAIALALSISTKMVEKHLASIYGKLQVSSRTEAAVVAIREKLIR